jgi:hypothetical protein
MVFFLVQDPASQKKKKERANKRNFCTHFCHVVIDWEALVIWPTELRVFSPPD